MAANSISTSNIQDDAVTAAKLADNSVFTAAIQNDAVTQAKIADDAVGNDQMAPNSVGTTELITSAVTTPKIANNAITTEKFASGAVDTAALGLNAVALTNMKGVSFAGAGVERLLHIATSGELTAKTLSTIGFGGAVSANLDFGAGPYKCVNLGAPTSSGEAIRFQDVFDGAEIVNGWNISTAYSTPRRHLMFGTTAHSNGAFTSGSPNIDTFLDITAGGNLQVQAGPPTYGTWLVIYITFNSSGARVASGVAQITSSTPVAVTTASSQTSTFIAMRYA
jgi:hypothetical protein